MLRSVLSGALLLMAAAVALPASSASADGKADIVQIAQDSQCIRYSWKNNRGQAPASYIEGMALVFARAACHPERADVRIVSSPNEGQQRTDALATYENRFASLGMKNDAAGIDTLRHTYVLLIGLGMMESSGKFCEGRDVSECFDEPDSAEAGLFQTSYGVGKTIPALMSMFADYQAGRQDCMLDTFQDHLTCRIRNSHNPRCPEATSDVVGTGPGADWQRLTKSCPAFATEYAAVVLRQHGGSRGEFGPIRRKQAEVQPACDAMLKDVEAYVSKHPQVCNSL